MTSISSSSSPSSSWPSFLRQTPWGTVVLLSLGVAAWLLLMQVASVQYLPSLDVGAWLGLVVLAWGAALWVVLLPLWALYLPVHLLDGPSVISPWRGTLVAMAGLLLAALVLWVGVWGLAPIYAAFGVFVLWVLMGLRASMVRLNLRHGLFVFAHDTLEVLMWALWGCLPWLTWCASGRTAQPQILQALTWVPLTAGLLALALAHVPAVLAPRLRTLAWMLCMALALAWLSRPAVFGQWANGMLGWSVQNRPVTLVLTEAGCNAANSALDKRVCWYDPFARQGVVRQVRMVSHQGDQVVVQMNHAQHKLYLSDAELQGMPWRRMVLQRSALIAWAHEAE